MFFFFFLFENSGCYALFFFSLPTLILPVLLMGGVDFHKDWKGAGSQMVTKRESDMISWIKFHLLPSSKKERINVFLKRIKEWKSIFVSHMKRNSVSAYANAIKVKPFDWWNTWCSSVFTHIIKVKTVTYYQMSFYLNSQRRDCLSYWAFLLICFPECGTCDVLCNFIWAVAGENQPTKQTWAIYWQLSMHLACRGIKVFKPEE